jgi:hypothetical protein
MKPDQCRDAKKDNIACPLQCRSFKLYNVQGQLVRELSNLNGKQFTVNRENLSGGLYLTELFEDGQLIKSAKLIVD